MEQNKNVPSKTEDGKELKINPYIKHCINYKHIHCDDPNFINIKLFLWQRILVNSMINLENSKLIDSKYYIPYDTNYGRFSERYGAGKTIMLLALIMPYSNHMLILTSRKFRHSTC